jgi:hypothetical protein
LAGAGKAVEALVAVAAASSSWRLLGRFSMLPRTSGALPAPAAAPAGLDPIDVGGALLAPASTPLGGGGRIGPAPVKGVAAPGAFPAAGAAAVRNRGSEELAQRSLSTARAAGEAPWEGVLAGGNPANGELPFTSGGGVGPA